jgi:hypothetical protein
MAEQQKPSIGRIVHYCLESGPKEGEYRPAIIVKVWSETCVNLQVFTDNDNDNLPNAYWVTSALEGEVGTKRTWCWPQRT